MVLEVNFFNIFMIVAGWKYMNREMFSYCTFDPAEGNTILSYVIAVTTMTIIDISLVVTTIYYR